MLLEVYQTAHIRGSSHKRLGEFSESRHATHVLALHVKAEGHYGWGLEEGRVKGPYLGVLMPDELDRNALVGPFEMYWCMLDAPFLQSGPGRNVRVDLNGQPLMRPHVRNLSPAEASKAIELFRELRRFALRPGHSARMSASARALELLSLWVESPAGGTHERRAVLLYRDLIEQYADRADESIDAIAGRVGLSADHLGMLFRKELGMTPIEFRTHVRLLRARQLLIDELTTVSEIAREVGFSDANYFSRVFRKVFGLSPRAYARANRPNVPRPAGN